MLKKKELRTTLLRKHLYSIVVSPLMNYSTGRYKKQSAEKNRIVLNRKLLVFLAAMIFCVSLFLMVNITSAMAETSHSDHTEGSLLGSHDRDEDGLSDELENDLMTDMNDKYGDKDKDGLYDFEEYLDHYGTPDNPADTPRYNYNDNTTYGNILDIYDYFNLGENKAGYIRDNITYTEENGGFTNYLLWNVTFSADLAGGSNSSNVTYENNHLVDVTFNGESAGGSDSGNVTYENNHLVDVTFNGESAGGSDSGNVTYENNHLVDVTFNGESAGGSDSGNVTYENNHLVNVTFTGGENVGGSNSSKVTYENNSLLNVTFADRYAGGSFAGNVTYENNHLVNVTFADRYAGGSFAGNVTYENNHLVNVTFADNWAGGSRSSAVTYMNNTLVNVAFTAEKYGGGSDSGNVVYMNNSLVNVVFNGSHSGGSDNAHTSYINNHLMNVSFLKSYAGGSVKGSVVYMNNTLVNIIFSKEKSGGSRDGNVIYENNSFVNTTFTGKAGGGSQDGTVTYVNNSLVGVTFSGEKAGGSQDGTVTYVNNTLMGVTFSGDKAGGSLYNDLIYENNSLVNATFSGLKAGGSQSGTVTYKNNDLVNVLFNGEKAGGSLHFNVIYMNNSLVNTTFSGLKTGGSQDGTVTYKNNDLMGVTFSGLYAGGSKDGSVTYMNNNLTSVNFSGNSTGGSESARVLYDGNMLEDVNFSGWYAGGRKGGVTIYRNNQFNDVQYIGVYSWGSSKITSGNNTIVNDSYDSDGDGLGDVQELFKEGLNPISSDSDNDSLNDGWELLYNGTFGVNPLTPANSAELESDRDGDRLNLSREEELGANPGDNDTDADGLNDSYEVKISTSPISNDTDEDGLNDGWEVRYSKISGVNATMPANSSVLESDRDDDRLTLLEESWAGTNASSNDTDGDSLNDRWEVRYKDAEHVNPVNPTSELDSDEDRDGLNLSREEELDTNPDDNDTDADGLNDKYEVDIDTDPLSNDTDDDGLLDGWEVQYSNVTGVNPLTSANSSELVLMSDGDKDDLTLLEESLAGTDPLSNDTDDDGLLDGWEVQYSNVTGVNPLTPANSSELGSDRDKDDLTLLEESTAGTDPLSNDTDDDGLLDGWEVLNSESSDINPLVKASVPELNSDEDDDGLSLEEEAVIGTNPMLNDTDGDGLDDGWETRYNDTDGVNPLIKATSEELSSDQDSDGLTLMEEYFIGSNPILNDTDGDGLPDRWEALYSESSGVDPLVKITAEELNSDEDNDDLSLKEEASIGTNPMLNDTDGDGLNDGWEELYVNLGSVDPLVKASLLELESDLDLDNLTLLEESIWGTDPLNDDTDEDGLNDGWEARYNDAYGVNPLIKATNEELFSDRDDDGLTLLQEAIENTDPEITDNTEISEPISTVTQSTTNYYFALFAVIATFIILLTLLIVTFFIIRYRRYKKRSLQKWRKML